MTALAPAQVALVSTVLQAVDYARAAGIVLPADLARDVRWVGILAKYDPDQPRAPQGSPEGGQWIALGATTSSNYGSAADALNSAPIDKASASARWRKKIQERYNTDRDFKTLVDTLMLYTQGSYDPVRIFAEYVVTGQIPPAWKDSGYVDDIATNATMYSMLHPLATYKTYFEGQADAEGWPQLGEDVSALEAAAVLQRSISDAAPLDISLYRGVTVLKQPVQVPSTYFEGEMTTEYVERPIPQAGETFDILGTSSFTTDENMARAFTKGEMRGQRKYDREVAQKAQFLAVYEILPGAHGVNASPVSPWNQKEVITAGRFEVVKVEPYDTGVTRKYASYYNDPNYKVPGYKITLRQIGVWDVDVEKHKRRPVAKARQSGAATIERINGTGLVEADWVREQFGVPFPREDAHEDDEPSVLGFGREKGWDESQHPRDPAGTATGGQWAPKDEAATGTLDEYISPGIDRSLPTIDTDGKVDRLLIDQLRSHLHEFPPYALSNISTVAVYSTPGQMLDLGNGMAGRTSADWDVYSGTIRMFDMAPKTGLDGAVGGAMKTQFLAHEVGHSIYDGITKVSRISEDGALLPAEIYNARIIEARSIKQAFDDAFRQHGDGVTDYSKAWNNETETFAEMYKIFHNSAKPFDGKVYNAQRGEEKIRSYLSENNQSGLADPFLDVLRYLEKRDGKRKRN